MHQLKLTLVGMPGSGKSTVGRQLARCLSLEFIDTDAELEKHFGHTIKEHFESFGEVSFRDAEHSILSVLLTGAAGFVLATGGGIVLRPENRELLKSANCTVVYLRTQIEDLYRRLRNDTQRPLLQVADPFARLKDLFEQRDPLYTDVADLIVDTGRLPVGSVVAALVARLGLAGIHDSVLSSHISSHE